MKVSKYTKSVTAGSLAAAMAMLFLVPFNMGGCAGDAGSMTSGIGSMVSGHGLGGGGGNRSMQQIDAGIKATRALTLDEQAEDAMGQSVALAVTNQYGLSSDEKLNKYVTLVGLTVASASSRPDGNWVFGVLEANEVNAFSGPNGYITVTRGALQQMENEAELAGVLAHEIAHVINRDGLSAVKTAGLLDAGLQAAKASNDQMAQFAPAADFIVDLVIKKGYGKNQEYKADADAVGLLQEAGYDPGGYHNFLQRIADQAGSGGSALMSTHPGAADRATRVADQIGGAQSGATLKERFEQNVPKQ